MSSVALAALELEPFATGLVRPTNMVQAPGDSDRFFFTEEHTGKVQIVENGSVTGTFLNIGGLLQTDHAERGLLGMAFHPNYQSNGKFYLQYTSSPNGNVRVSEFTVSAGNPALADPNSERVLVDVVHPDPSHNAGQLTFGPNDGYLYFGIGALNSPPQDINDLRGKILRIDVDGNNSGNGQYGNPATNPFVGHAGADEIWAYGVRNPWRFTFDEANGDMYMGDVGGNVWEEINYQHASSTGGENYGWQIYEGHCLSFQASCTPITDPNFAWPILVRSHDPPDNAIAIIGGYVYRGDAVPELYGRYLFGDWVSKEIFSFVNENGTAVDLQDHTSDLDAEGALNGSNMTSFAVDNEGEMYIIGLDNGTVFKIKATLPSYYSADFDNSGEVDGGDFLILQQGFNQFSGNATKADGDATGNGFVNNADLQLWEEQYGFISPTVSATAVPEPVSGLLLIQAMWGMSYFRRRGRTRECQVTPIC